MNNFVLTTETDNEQRNQKVIMSVKKLFENVMDYPDDSKLAQIGNAPAKQSSNATEFKFVHPSVTKSRSKEIAIEIWNIVPSVE